MKVECRPNGILYPMKKELLQITPCGKNAIRFRSFPAHEVIDENYNLLPQEVSASVSESENAVTLTVGTLTAELCENGKVTFFCDGRVLLSEQPEFTFESGWRDHKSLGGGFFSSRVTFESYADEHFFGLGHHLGNRFDQKGCAYDLVNTNANNFIPFVLSSRGYGFLWNCPSTGRVEFAANRTRWQSDACRFVDYVVIAGSPAEISATLADLTGHARPFPEWAGGLWQSRLRYETQEQLLAVARRYRDEGIPLAVIVADYFHWTEQGDYKFDPRYWPDVRAMTDELHAMGTRLAVSVWPTVNENSENYEQMRREGLLIRTHDGSNRVFNFYGPQCEIDATNPAARAFVWQKLKENYLDNGVDLLWLDEGEPEINPVDFGNLEFSRGNGTAVAMLSPYDYVTMVADGMRSLGREEYITLTRAGYFGCQTKGALVWSGDIRSDFATLEAQVHGALNASVCGNPWWNSDVGGFYGGDTTSDEFRELIVRWFQFGVFCPVLRLHGNRCRHGESSGLKEASGDPNELWSFGERNFAILKEWAALRERLRPYLKAQLDACAVTGLPLMRPLFYAAPDDPNCYTEGEEYYFGDDILFAPVVEQGQTERTFYVPEGEWVLTLNGKQYGKGRYTVPVALSEAVVLVRRGAAVLDAFGC